MEKLKNWEIKDRSYVLKGMSPLSYTVGCRGKLWWDEKNGVNREIRYALNQDSPFMDEQKGPIRLGHITFTDGVLHVSRTNQALQKLLSIYHPSANNKWSEVNPEAEAADEVDIIEIELDALDLARELEVDHLEAVLRAEMGSGVNKLSVKELRREGYRFARTNPSLFTELANDEDIKLRHLANQAVEMKILHLAENNTVFKWSSNKRKVFTIPHDENPYKALAQHFLTDEGSEVMKSILKKLEE